MEPIQKLFGGGGTTVVVPPAPPPPKTPTLTDAAARAERDRADDLARKRGRAASVLTGPEGVGATPVQVKTLVGS